MSTKSKEKQIRDFSLIYGSKYGVSMDLEFTRLSSKERALVCLIKGILIFLCAYGSAGLFLTSFGLPSVRIVLFLFILVVSLAAALFYYNRLVFNIGYVLFFVVICLLAYFLYLYANSGMNAILNTALQIVDDKLNLHGVREYEEIIKNRRVTVTCCMILISCLTICFYNSAISGYMSPLLSFLLMYPVVQICAYFDNEINYFYLGMMLLGFLGVCILRKSGRYYMPYRGIAPDVKVKGEKVFHNSRRFTKTVSNLSVISVVILAVLLLAAGLLVSMAPRRYKNNYSTWKSGTDDIVREFALNGMMGFFNHYTAIGGLNEGRLGGIRQVVMTLEPQLDIRIVPDNVEGIYLRGFIGDYYSDNQWRHISDKDRILSRQYGISDTESLVNLESTQLKELFESEGSPYSAHAYMTVKNLSSPDKYFYTPYYSYVDFSPEAEIDSSSLDYYGDYVLYGIRTKNREIKHTYYPFHTIREQLDSGEIDPQNNMNELLYRRFVYANYLNIPSGISDDLRQICDEHITGTDRSTVIAQIYQYFVSEFKYTLSPGITPSRRDFVVYFLTQQKRGFCAHFASAAAMLLRAKGIPARYVEGYYLQFTDATILETDETVDVTEWYQGYNATVEGDEEPSLIEIQARGADAHAWVEVYYDGFGWIPVEFTVADSEESEESGSFWERFRGYFGSEEKESSPVDNVTDQLQNAAPYVFSTLGIAAVIVVVLLVLVFLHRKYRLYYRRGNERLVAQYISLGNLLRRFGFSEENNIFHNRMKEYMTTVIGASAEDAGRYVSLVEKASFSNEALDAAELTQATDFYRTTLKNMKHKVSLPKRIHMKLFA